MSFRAARLGVAEWLIGVGSVALLVDLFAVTWFAYRPQYHVTAMMLGQTVSANGWQTSRSIGPLALVVSRGWDRGVAGCRRRDARRRLPVVVTTLLAAVLARAGGRAG